MIVRIFAVSAVALVVGSYIERARAGQFFVCEDGRTVEVAFNELDEAKRTDPCVAKYYGLSVAEPALRGKAGEPVAVGGTVDIVLPVRKPVRVQLRQARDDAPAAKRDLSGQQRMATVDAAGEGRVKIINAKPGEAQWFELKP